MKEFPVEFFIYGKSTLFRIFFVFGIIFTLVGSSFSIVYAAGISSENQVSHTDNVPQENSQQSIPKSNRIQNHKDNFQDQKNEIENFFDVKITDVLLAIFTGLLVIVGAIQAYWVFETINQMRSTEERQLRAYVGVRKVWISELSTTYDFRIKIEIENFGQTPAKGCVMKCQIFVTNFPLDDPLPENRLQEVAGKIPLMPSESIKPILNYRLSSEEFSNVFGSSKKGKSIYIKGKVQYSDHLNHIRETNFLFYFNTHVDRMVPYEETDAMAKWKTMAFYMSGNEIT